VYCLLAGVLIVLATLVSVGAAADRGELKIEGTHIARLVLRRDDGHTEKWSDLGRSVSLPVGTYSVQELKLRGDCPVQSPAILGHIEVTKNKPAMLKAGGPLRQKVEVKRQGRTLVLSYRLLGIGDEAYGPPGSPDKRASFTVYRGEKVIATDAFEYG